MVSSWFTSIPFTGPCSRARYSAERFWEILMWELSWNDEREKQKRCICYGLICRVAICVLVHFLIRPVSTYSIVWCDVFCVHGFACLQHKPVSLFFCDSALVENPLFSVRIGISTVPQVYTANREWYLPCSASRRTKYQRRTRLRSCIAFRLIMLSHDIIHNMAFFMGHAIALPINPLVHPSQLHFHWLII